MRLTPDELVHVVRSLRSGVCPARGIQATRATLREPTVFAALEQIEAMLLPLTGGSRAGRSIGGNTSSETSRPPRQKTMAFLDTGTVRTGQPWSKEEEDWVRKAHQEGRFANLEAEFAHLGQRIGRTARAVQVRLAQLGLVDFPVDVESGDSERSASS